MPTSWELTRVLQEFSFETGFLVKDLIPMIVEFAMPLGECLVQTLSPESKKFSVWHDICLQCGGGSRPLVLDLTVYEPCKTTAFLCLCCYGWVIAKWDGYGFALDSDFLECQEKETIWSHQALRNRLMKLCLDLMNQ